MYVITRHLSPTQSYECVPWLDHKKGHFNKTAIMFNICLRNTAIYYIHVRTTETPHNTPLVQKPMSHTLYAFCITVTVCQRVPLLDYSITNKYPWSCLLGVRGHSFDVGIRVAMATRQNIFRKNQRYTTYQAARCFKKHCNSGGSLVKCSNYKEVSSF